MNEIWIGSISALIGTLLGAAIPVVLESRRDAANRKYAESEKYEVFNRAMFNDFFPSLDKLIFSLTIERIDFKDETEDRFKEQQEDHIKESMIADYREVKAIFDGKIKETYPLELIGEIGEFSKTLNSFEFFAGISSTGRVLIRMDKEIKQSISKNLDETSKRAKEKLKNKYF